MPWIASYDYFRVYHACRPTRFFMCSLNMLLSEGFWARELPLTDWPTPTQVRRGAAKRTVATFDYDSISHGNRQNRAVDKHATRVDVLLESARSTGYLVWCYDWRHQANG